MSWIPLALIGFFPLLKSWNYWPAPLSFNMYAGDNTEGILFAPKSVFRQLPTVLADLSTKHCLQEEDLPEDRCHLIVDDWAFAELRVAPFSTPRRLKQVARYFCSCLPEQEQAGLQILETSGWKKEKPWQTFYCKDLLNRQ